MRRIAFRLAAVLLGLVAPVSTAQITLTNFASGGPAGATTVGGFHRIETAAANVRVGRGSCERRGATANAAYLPTGVALDATGNGGCAGARPGFTIQFWLKQDAASATTFGYLFGDAAWIGGIGAFRCFQNGAAGVGNLLVRGPFSAQLATVGAPLTAAAGGWVHIAFVYDGSLGAFVWYVDGQLNVTAAATVTPSTANRGVNLAMMGYDGSSADGVPGVGKSPAHYDDVRIYDWARSGSDIATDYRSGAGGTGPSGCANTPDLGYYPCESTRNPHRASIALRSEPGADGVRLFTVGDTIEWGVTSPGAGPYRGTALINVVRGAGRNPRTDAYRRPGPLWGGPAVTSLGALGVVAGLELRTCVSSPAGTAYAFPDGVGIGALVAPCGGGAIAIPYGYPSPQSPNVSFAYSSNVFGLADGDTIEIQWVSTDSSYSPLPIAVSNRCTFEFVTPTRQGPAVHVEARGVNTIQDTGFFEVWNTGTVPITQVEIDLVGTTAAGWNPTGRLNSGGTLATGDSFRFQTDAICDLVPGTNPRYVLRNGTDTLRFTFAAPPASAGGFQGPTNHFLFDCDTAVTGTGAAFVGALVRVTFADNTVRTGTLAADPNDPLGAQVDL